MTNDPRTTAQNAVAAAQKKHETAAAKAAKAKEGYVEALRAERTAYYEVKAAEANPALIDIEADIAAILGGGGGAPLLATNPAASEPPAETPRRGRGRPAAQPPAPTLPPSPVAAEPTPQPYAPPPLQPQPAPVQYAPPPGVPVPQGYVPPAPQPAYNPDGTPIEAPEPIQPPF